MHLKDLKEKTPADLVAMAEELGVEGASTMRRQDLMFCILRELAEDEDCLLYTSPSPRDRYGSRMPSSA